MIRHTLFLFIGILTYCTAGAQQSPTTCELLVRFDRQPGIPIGSTIHRFQDVPIPTNIKAAFLSVGVTSIRRAVPSFEPKDTLQVLDDGRIYRPPDHSKLFVIGLSTGTNCDSVIVHLMKTQGISHVERNERAISNGSPNDSRFNEQWNLQNQGQSGGVVGADVKATSAWDITAGNSSTKIGIVDVGVQSDHPDLKTLAGVSRVTDNPTPTTQHGTHVAGIAAATGGNGIGVAGMDWNCQIVAENYGEGWYSDDVDAINRAVSKGAQIINCSWSFADYSSEVYSTMRAAYEAGVLFVTANPESFSPGGYPSSYGNWILDVAALQDNGSVTSYNIARSYVDVAAPGGNGAPGHPEKDILSTITGSGWGTKYGTSMAAPHVTGLAGLLRGVNAALYNYDLEEIIKRSTTQYPSFNGDVSILVELRS